MKPSQLRWTWLLFGLLALVILIIALIPRLIGDTSRFADLVGTELSAWTGGELKFTGPVRVRFLPDVSVRGPIELSNSKRLPAIETLVAKEAKVSLDLVDLLRGRITIDALRLLKPRITLRDGIMSGAAPAGESKSLFATLFGGAPVRVLHIRRGKIILPGVPRSGIEEIFAHLDAGKETGAVSGFGSFVYKHTTIRYTLESGSVTATEGAESLPIAVSMTSKPFRLQMNGTASNAAGFTVDGDMQAAVDDGRRFFRWLDIDIPPGNSLKGFSAAGAFHLAGTTLSFDDGTFTLDGNRAVGLLALTAAKPRPRLEGTLAFDRLVLDPYLSSTESRASQSSTPEALVPFPFNHPLLQFIDADLRISAAAIEAGALKLGRGAFTIAAKQGVLASEIGELELCGGSADGRLNADLSKARKDVNIVADLAGVSIEACLGPLGLALPVRGTADVKAELAGSGADLSELIGTLAGPLKVEAKDGVVPVDFAQLAAGPTPIGEGWTRDAVTGFNLLDADCRLGGGTIACQSLSMETPGGTISGSGDIDLTKQTLDWDLTVADRIVPTRASQLTQGEAATVSLRGSLAQPAISRADRPTLGEGSVQTSPATEPPSRQ